MEISAAIKSASLALAVALLVTSAHADDCPYLSATEFLTAVENADGSFQVKYWTEDYFVGLDSEERCTIASVEGGAWAVCEGGWSGPFILAGSSLQTPLDGGILVLLNEVMYRTCRT